MSLNEFDKNKKAVTEAVKVKKTFRQVSLPTLFADSLEAKALGSGRSVAKQIEHYAIIAEAVENALPSARVLELKGGANPLAVLASYKQEFEKGFLGPAGEAAWGEAAIKVKAAQLAKMRQTNDLPHDSTFQEKYDATPQQSKPKRKTSVKFTDTEKKTLV